MVSKKDYIQRILNDYFLVNKTDSHDVYDYLKLAAFLEENILVKFSDNELNSINACLQSGENIPVSLCSLILGMVE